jgi:hypothetical protein
VDAPVVLAHVYICPPGMYRSRSPSTGRTTRLRLRRLSRHRAGSISIQLRLAARLYLIHTTSARTRPLRSQTPRTRLPLQLRPHPRPYSRLASTRRPRRSISPRAHPLRLSTPPPSTRRRVSPRPSLRRAHTRARTAAPSPPADASLSVISSSAHPTPRAQRRPDPHRPPLSPKYR